ncbi:MAG TPA: hypothetical protein VFB99_08105 [Vicinamibacterales bacterium]|nr:hypothetical protein [Vicinamibacterales bacterium]
MSKGETSVYICADGTLTYGPYGGKKKIVPQALPIAIAHDEDEAKRLIVTIGRAAYDVPEADAHFEQQLKGKRIEPGYGPTYRYYYSGPEFERDNVDTLFAVREAVEQRLARIRHRDGTE